MRTHELKIERRFLERILDGSKNFEIRFNDRDFQKGDELFLRPVDQQRGALLIATITYVLHFPEGLKDGWVALGIEVSDKNKKAFKDLCY